MFQLRLFQRESYDYKEIFAQHIAELRSLQSRDQLLNTALSSLADVFAVESACVLLRDEKAGTLTLQSRLGSAPEHIKLSEKSPVVLWFKNRDEPLTMDSVTNARFPKQRDKILKVFVELKAAALVPLQFEKGLIGLVAIGAPRGQRCFNKEEKELLGLFAYEMAIAVQNSVLYDRVLKQNAKLQELASLKDSFISNMTHELATPLHNIIGLAQALADGADGDVNAAQQEHLEMISRAGEQLLKIHRAILDLSQLEHCPEQIAIKKVNIAEMVGDMMPWLEAQAAPRENQIHNTVKTDIPRVYGDEACIRQVFEKILENAARFTAQGKISIHAESAGDMLRLLVEDSGTGIDMAHQNEIFEPFYQVDGGMTRHHGGPGLGLALARKIVELHGGRLWLESKPGEGSRFYFTLPIRPANIPALEMVSR